MKYFGITRLLSFLSVFLVLWTALACSTGTGGDTEFGGPNLNPDPEDIFDLPNPLPDSFLAHACPDGLGSGTVMDLDVRISSPTAPLHDFDRDGDMDSILLVRGDPSPKTLIFRIDILNGTLLSTDIDLFHPVSNLFLGGYEWNEHLLEPDNDPSDMTQSFASDILPLFDDGTTGSWTNTGHNPIVEQFYVPGEVLPDPAFPNHAQVCPAGTEGVWAPCDPAPVGAAGVLYDKPGVHVVAAHILETDGTLHCSHSVWRILICPVACHCDAQGNPLNNRNCIP